MVGLLRACVPVRDVSVSQSDLRFVRSMRLSACVLRTLKSDPTARECTSARARRKTKVAFSYTLPLQPHKPNKLQVRTASDATDILGDKRDKYKGPVFTDQCEEDVPAEVGPQFLDAAFAAREQREFVSRLEVEPQHHRGRGIILESEFVRSAARDAHLAITEQKPASANEEFISSLDLDAPTDPSRVTHQFVGDVKLVISWYLATIFGSLRSALMAANLVPWPGRAKAKSTNSEFKSVFPFS